MKLLGKILVFNVCLPIIIFTVGYFCFIHQKTDPKALTSLTAEELASAINIKHCEIAVPNYKKGVVITFYSARKINKKPKKLKKLFCYQMFNFCNNYVKNGRIRLIIKNLGNKNNDFDLLLLGNTHKLNFSEKSRLDSVRISTGAPVADIKNFKNSSSFLKLSLFSLKTKNEIETTFYYTVEPLPKDFPKIENDSSICIKKYFSSTID